MKLKQILKKAGNDIAKTVDKAVQDAGKVADKAVEQLNNAVDKSNTSSERHKSREILDTTTTIFEDLNPARSISEIEVEITTIENQLPIPGLNPALMEHAKSILESMKLSYNKMQEDYFKIKNARGYISAHPEEEADCKYQLALAESSEITFNSAKIRFENKHKDAIECLKDIKQSIIRLREEAAALEQEPVDAQQPVDAQPRLVRFMGEAMPEVAVDSLIEQPVAENMHLVLRLNARPN